MVAQCANPRCGVPFRYLRQGRLFLVERRNGNGNGNSKGHRPTTRLEYFWLCSECASHLTLTTEQDSGLVQVAEARAGQQPFAASR